MAQQTTQTPAPTPPKKVSHKGSITGFILALVSLTSSGIAHLVINAKYTPTGPTTGSIEAEAGHAVATGTTSVLGAIFGMWFLVGAIVIALLATVFIVVRLPKVKMGGLIFSIIAMAIVAWSLSLAFGGFDLIKADPVE